MRGDRRWRRHEVASLLATLPNERMPLTELQQQTEGQPAVGLL